MRGLPTMGYKQVCTEEGNTTALLHQLILFVSLVLKLASTEMQFLLKVSIHLEASQIFSKHNSLVLQPVDWLASLYYIETGTVWLTQWLIFSKSEFGQHSSPKQWKINFSKPWWFVCALDHMVVKEKWIKSSENRWSFLCKQSQNTTK